MKINIRHILIILLFFFSCRSESQQKMTLNTDLELFSKMVKLNPLSQKVEWETVQLGDGEFGTSDYRIYALLDYSNLSEEKYKKIFKAETPHLDNHYSTKDYKYIIKDFNREWIPKYIKQKLTPNYINDNKRKANQFYDIYTQGYYITLPSERKILLHLFTT